MNQRGSRKTLTGVVVSNKMDKTAVVAVERRHRHRIYRKIIRTTTRYKAHDADNLAKVGDLVRIVETRPLSKDKRWRIAETMTVGNVADLAPRDIGAPPAPEEPLASQVAVEPTPDSTGAAEEPETPTEAAEPAAEESETPTEAAEPAEEDSGT